MDHYGLDDRKIKEMETKRKISMNINESFLCFPVVNYNENFDFSFLGSLNNQTVGYSSIFIRKEKEN